MGIEIAFDFFPPLGSSESEQKKWKRFIVAVILHFNKDTLVKLTQEGLEFKICESPFLPLDGTVFRRFQAKVNSRHNVRNYVDPVARICREHFGEERVHFWTTYGEDE